MKTAMQELIEILQTIKKELNTKWDGDPLARRGIVIAINEATKLLKKEKEQIINAWNDGDYSYFYNKETGRDFEDGAEYYNKVFNK
jgi:hypothetical protein